jgi:hypothetical protein
VGLWRLEVRGLRQKSWKLKGGPAAVGGALQSSLFELRPDKSLEIGGKIPEDKKLGRLEDVNRGIRPLED